MHVVRIKMWVMKCYSIIIWNYLETQTPIILTGERRSHAFHFILFICCVKHVTHAIMFLLSGFDLTLEDFKSKFALFTFNACASGRHDPNSVS